MFDIHTLDDLCWKAKNSCKKPNNVVGTNSTSEKKIVAKDSATKKPINGTE